MFPIVASRALPVNSQALDAEPPLPVPIRRAIVRTSTTKANPMPSSTTAPQRHDPIRKKYFRPVEIAEGCSSFLFYIAAILSFAVLLVDSAAHPGTFDVIQIAFAIVAGALFALDLVNRIYWAPTALDQRRADLLSNAYRVPLTHEQTTGYYNNDENDSLRRLGFEVLENSHFSRNIALKMAKTERIKVVIYAIALVAMWLNRSTDLAIAATAAQVIFSEHIVSNWFRLEWFRIRCNTTYEHLRALFQSAPTGATLHAQVLKWFAFYETSKSNSGITLSSEVFAGANESLSREWEEIKNSLNPPGASTQP